MILIISPFKLWAFLSLQIAIPKAVAPTFNRIVKALAVNKTLINALKTGSSRLSQVVKIINRDTTALLHRKATISPVVDITSNSVNRIRVVPHRTIKTTDNKLVGTLVDISNGRLNVVVSRTKEVARQIEVAINVLIHLTLISSNSDRSATSQRGFLVLKATVTVEVTAVINYSVHEKFGLT